MVGGIGGLTGSPVTASFGILDGARPKPEPETTAGDVAFEDWRSYTSHTQLP